MDRYLDTSADTLPAGLHGTPFDAVYQALRSVAASVWAVDPSVYRAGIAWGWYLLHNPGALDDLREMVVAALISAQAPMVKDTQTTAELVEYLRIWRSYTPTFERLQAIYATFGVTVDIQPISDEESQSVLPVSDRRLAFYIRVVSMDWSRPLTLVEISEIAARATPLGSRPYPYYALVGDPSDVPVVTGYAGINTAIRSEIPAALPSMQILICDSSTGSIVGGAGIDIETQEVEAVVIDSYTIIDDNT